MLIFLLAGCGSEVDFDLVNVKKDTYQETGHPEVNPSPIPPHVYLSTYELTFFCSPDNDCVNKKIKIVNGSLTHKAVYRPEIIGSNYFIVIPQEYPVLLAPGKFAEIEIKFYKTTYQQDANISIQVDKERLICKLYGKLFLSN